MDKKAKYRKIAEANGISNNMFNNRLFLGWSMERAATEPKNSKNKFRKKDIAIYHGDKFYLWGTVAEVAKKMGKNERDVVKLCAPSTRKRAEQTNQLYGIYIEDEDDEYASRHFQ